MKKLDITITQNKFFDDGFTWVVTLHLADDKSWIIQRCTNKQTAVEERKSFRDAFTKFLNEE
jgi:hypothetical protein